VQVPALTSDGKGESSSLRKSQCSPQCLEGGRVTEDVNDSCRRAPDNVQIAETTEPTPEKCTDVLMVALTTTVQEIMTCLTIPKAEDDCPRICDDKIIT
jgi:hypothetical protein